MIVGDYNFDMARAKDGTTPEYGDAYNVSNEPLDWEMGLTPVAGRRVLTVAASGDQPLMYAAHGASHIDTFDLTYNAHVITDFKTTALNIVGYDDYKAIISTIHDLPDSVKQFGPTFAKILEHMPMDTAAAMREYVVHNPNAFCREFNSSVLYPINDAQYNAMRRAVKRPFDFIWADLINVAYYTAQKYDIINISNIFDYYVRNGRSEHDAIKTIALLWHRLETGGQIVCLGSFTYNDILKCLRHEISNSGMGQTELKRHSDAVWTALVIQKLR